jgi:hypothetical protein
MGKFYSLSILFLFERKNTILIHHEHQGHPINSRVDSLLKAEFDELRKNQQPHPIFKKHNLNFVPYKLDQEKLDAYRNNRKGIEAKSTKTKFTLFGALDDLWLNKDT